MIYVFYRTFTESEKPKQRPACDLQKITIYLIGIEFTLLFKYREYEDIFSKEKYKIISKEISVTHTINLKEKIKSFYNLIYALLERELRIC